MKITTTRFGEIEISDDMCFSMVNPILGYENEFCYVLIEHKENSNFRWLQSVQNPELAFPVTIAGSFGIDYAFELPDQTQEELEINHIDDLLVLNLVVIPHENPRASTINLLAPLIFNIKTKKGSQIILSGTGYVVDYPLIEKEAVC